VRISHKRCATRFSSGAAFSISDFLDARTNGHSTGPRFNAPLRFRWLQIDAKLSVHQVEKPYTQSFHLPALGLSALGMGCVCQAHPQDHGSVVELIERYLKLIVCCHQEIEKHQREWRAHRLAVCAALA
jgi:hypothetical protein